MDTKEIGNSTLNGLWVGSLGDANAWYHIYPFAQAKQTDVMHIVRHTEAYYQVPGAVYYNYKKRNAIHNCIKLFFKGRKVLKNNKIDYIITFNPAPFGSIAWILAKLYKKPISVGLIGGDFRIGLKTAWYKKLLWKVVKTSDYVTVTGNAMIPYLLDNGIEKNRLGIFPHCIKDNWFIERKSTGSKYDIITVSTLSKRKRIHDILLAMAILKGKGIEPSFAIIGEGETENHLRAIVKEHKLEKQVHFLGFKKNVIDYLSQSRIYAQSSEYEGLSISLIEAMAAGLIPVATKAGSEEDIIETGKNGVLVDIGKPEEIASALEQVLEKDKYKRFLNEVLNMRDSFRMTTAVKASEEIIESLIKNPK